MPFMGGHWGLHCNPSPGISSVGHYEGVVQNSPMYIFLWSGMYVYIFTKLCLCLLFHVANAK